MRVIITGGTGLIGSALAASLGADGHEVVVLSRNPAQYTTPAGVRAEKWDGKTAESWGHLADGADAIVNLAGESVAGEGLFPSRWTPERKERILQSRLNAGKAVVQAIEAAQVKPKVLIQSSAVGYYGPRGDELVDETALPGNDFLAQVVIEWEGSTAVLEAMDVRRVLIRTGVVLSPNGGALRPLVLPFKLFAGGPIGSGNQWFPWIHIEDEVQAIRFLIENETAQGVFNLSAPHPLTNKAFARVIGQVLKRPSFIPVPAFALQLMFGEVATALLTGQRAIPQRLQTMNFTFKYPEAPAALRNLLL